MRILFNASQCGLGNNGGSRTIIRTAEALNKCGVEEDIYAVVDNYTLHNHTANIINTPNFSIYTDIVCVSVWDVTSTIELQRQHKYNNCVWWVRGWETWVSGEQQFINKLIHFRGCGGKFFANSTHIKDKCANVGIDAELLIAGVDHDLWGIDNKTRDRSYVGCLVHKRFKCKRGDDAIDMIRYAGLKPMILHSDAGYDPVRMRKLYNDCSIWLHLSQCDGFANTPIEAALCGCHIITTADSVGVIDYVNNNTADIALDDRGVITLLRNQTVANKLHKSIAMLDKLYSGSYGRDSCVHRLYGLLGRKIRILK